MKIWARCGSLESWNIGSLSLIGCCKGQFHFLPPYFSWKLIIIPLCHNFCLESILSPWVMGHFLSCQRLSFCILLMLTLLICLGFFADLPQVEFWMMLSVKSSPSRHKLSFCGHFSSLERRLCGAVVSPRSALYRLQQDGQGVCVWETRK